ncbi:metallo-hydrolase [Companilactobacillus sp. RD055328]|uniref:MBL fold metallo-hydrolase n=1 Tax=Companilactobacillus sp. RD055328 TaxID=2916634 RepID=UPI001FC8C28B|nr:MBL fold metallo-hydrolase [Companilactobacillus sp. RD055328]GKQ43333.1 metallo-hydrolase [Companilactobacillus sp. RD055328]
MTSDFKISVLASSSKGNSTYIETPNSKILIDAGLSGKKIENAMKSIDRDLSEVDSILVTHEHSDHIQGVGVLARKYDMQIYANEGTWNAMNSKIGKVPSENKYVFGMGSTLTIGDLDIESFGVSHDAAEPQFYQVHYDNKSFAVLTDTGYVSERIKNTIKSADAYLMECNHDLDMLRNGDYAWSLKQRILSDQGHLSNLDGANTLEEIIGNNTKQIFLGHLSPDNNLKDLAHRTVAEDMMKHDLGVEHDFHISDTDPEQAQPLYGI